MRLQVLQFQFTAQANIELLGAGAAGFVKPVETDQHGAPLKTAHQVAQTVELIKHIYIFPDMLRFALDQMQPVRMDETHIDLVFNSRPARRITMNDNVARHILNAALLPEPGTGGIHMHFQPAAVGNESRLLIWEADQPVIEAADTGILKQL